jgi:RNA polymerase sigma factor (sigma-70 family)
VDEFRKSGNLDVLGVLYSRYMELIYGVCLKYLKDPENAQDAVMNLFEELISKIPKHEIDHFKGWVYTVAKNHCLMRLRSEKRKPTVKIDTDLMQSESDWHLNGELENEQDIKQLEFCLNQLIPEQRRVIELFYLEKKCYNEISASTGLDWNKVRSFIQNGRRNLKICMEKQYSKTVTK